MFFNLRYYTGHVAELVALAYLYTKGLRLLQKNYRCTRGELDLVMLEGVANNDHGVLVIVEVRFRQHGYFGGASASVNLQKQQRIISATQVFLQQHANLRALPCRFDVVAINLHQIQWIKHAFEL